MKAYYNEHDPHAAQWLRNLIAGGHIAPGIVDESDIRDIVPAQLLGYTQCHFFAGIGVWSHALRRAGWSDDRPIWTGSCPCQPFSAAGAGAGFADERHLWPAFNHLIDQCRPPIVVGEQVENAGAWLDLVSTDLEAQGYAFGAAFLPAAGFGGAHIRSRNYWVADLPNSDGRRGERGTQEGIAPDDERRRGPASRSTAGGLAVPDGGNAGAKRQQRSGEQRFESGNGQPVDSGPTHAPVLGRDPVDWLFCRDAKWRPVEPGFFEVAYEIAARMGQLCPSTTQEAEKLIHEAARGTPGY